MPSFELYINPVPKGRPRLGRYSTYTPARTRKFEFDVRLLAREKYKGEPLEKPLVVTLGFFFAYKGKTLTSHTKKPDLDNLAKGVLDAMNGILWKDDAQICNLHLSKQYGKTSKIIIFFDELSV